MVQNRPSSVTLMTLIVIAATTRSAVLKDSKEVDGQCTCTDYYSSRIARVYHGDDAFPGDFPWQVSVQEFNKYGTKTWDHICGGTLISDSHVLTAKHCMGLAAKDYRVIVGTVYRNDAEPQNTYSVSDYKFYPKPDRVMYDHDLAILKIKSEAGNPMKCSDRVKPICLGNLTTDVNTSCYISGWGETHASPISDTLQYAKVSINSHETCAAIWNNRSEITFDRFTPSMMCAGPLKGGVDSCLGDSGGPLVCINDQNHLAYLLGIVSWSTVCGKRPSVYSKVSEHLWWIHAEITAKE